MKGTYVGTKRGTSAKEEVDLQGGIKIILELKKITFGFLLKTSSLKLMDFGLVLRTSEPSDCAHPTA